MLTLRQICRVLSNVPSFNLDINKKDCTHAKDLITMQKGNGYFDQKKKIATPTANHGGIIYYIYIYIILSKKRTKTVHIYMM